MTSVRNLNSSLFDLRIVWNTMGASLCVNDDTFGPAARGCRGDFDFTLVFERTILSIFPNACFAILAVVRLTILSRRPRIIDHIMLRNAKIVSRRPELLHSGRTKHRAGSARWFLCYTALDSGSSSQELRGCSSFAVTSSRWCRSVCFTLYHMAL